MILRGVKSIEVRTVETNVCGPIYLYASKKPAEDEHAEAAAGRWGLDLGLLPRGVILGTVEIVECRLCTPEDAEAALVPQAVLSGKRAWVLKDPRRLEIPLKPRFLPYGIWFYPFQRRGRRLKAED